MDTIRKPTHCLMGTGMPTTTVDSFYGLDVGDWAISPLADPLTSLSLCTLNNPPLAIFMHRREMRDTGETRSRDYANWRVADKRPRPSRGRGRLWRS